MDLYFRAPGGAGRITTYAAPGFLLNVINRKSAGLSYFLFIQLDAQVMRNRQSPLEQ
jgi:hypothetical protein